MPITGSFTAVERSSRDATYHEYTTAADPIASGATPPLPYAEFPSSMYAEGPTRVLPLDLSEKLKCVGPATTPALVASYLRILAHDSLITRPQATSELYYVIAGEGASTTKEGSIPWKKGDIFVLPGGEAFHSSTQDASLYWVTDEPLLRYLGVRRDEPRFQPTLYRHNEVMKQLMQAANDPDAGNRSRVSVLLGNKNFQQTLTITHVLWAMFGLVQPGTRQLPHRHQSVALDFVVEAKPGCYTLVGTELDEQGNIRDARRVDWLSGGAFVTPPGYWHEHRNESDSVAYILPIQDAGLHTYLRTLDIRFDQEG